MAIRDMVHVGCESLPYAVAGSLPDDVSVAEHLTENENAEKKLAIVRMDSNVMKCPDDTFFSRNCPRRNYEYQ